MLLVRLSDIPFELLYVGMETISGFNSKVTGIITSVNYPKITVRWFNSNQVVMFGNSVTERVGAFVFVYIKPGKCKKFLALAKDVVL